MKHNLLEIIWLVVCAVSFSFGIANLNPETPGWVQLCLVVGISWLFATLNSINNRLLK